MTVLGVVGGRGGVGASLFAAALASRAAEAYGRSVLIDLDPTRGGIDVLLGIEEVRGARWSGLRLAGGHLDPEVLVDGLPQWGSVSVLAADEPAEASPDAVDQAIEVARQVGPVVLDLSRWASESRAAGVRRCDLVVLVVVPDVAGVTGARCVAAGIDAPLGVLIRGGRSSARSVPQLVGARLLGRLPSMGRPRDHDAVVRRRAGQVASGVLDAVAAAQ
jgi:MinD-like ATPase involved in chromosome partitioning or flagellar assembly